MSLSKTLAFTAVVGSALAGHAAFPVRAGEMVRPGASMTPLKAKTFDMGDKRAVAFYENLGSACKVTVLVADRLDETGPLPTASVRFDTVVAAGTSARVGTANGPDLSVACAASASALTIETQARPAYTVAAKK